jgi:uncharacterized protein involved in exopolysaccharide biosynthesis
MVAAPAPAPAPANEDALLALLKGEESEAPSLPKRLSPGRLLRGVLLRWRMIALLLLAFAVAGVTVALTMIERKWEGGATLIVSDRKSALSVGGGQPYQTRDYGLETLMDTLKLPSSLDEAIRRSGVKTSRTQLATAVKVSLSQKSDVINLRVVWTSPKEAAALANNLADVFVERTTRIRAEQAQQDLASYQQQLANARRTLGGIDAEVLAFQQQSQVANFDEETKARAIDLSRMQAEQWASQGEVDALRAARADFAAALAAVPDTVTATLFRNPLGKRLDETEWQLKEARSRYTEDNPKVINLREQAAALKKLAAGSEFSGGETTRSPNDLKRDLQVKLQDLVTNLHVAEGRAAGMAVAIQNMQARVAELAAEEKQYRQLEARQTAARDLEKSLSAKVEEARVAAVAGESTLQVVEHSHVPTVPEQSARKALFVAFIILGGLLGLGLALLFELVDRRVRCREDVEDAVGKDGSSLEVPRVGTGAADAASPQHADFRVFRRFVNEICANSGHWSSIAVVSPGPGDGRSTVARALAACLAARGNEVVLVDADLRASAGPRCVTAAGPGTADAIARRVPIANCLSPGDSEHLAVIPCGDALLADHASLRLGQQDTARLLSDVAVQGRRMIVDLPPAWDDEGAFETACHASAVVIATRHGTTDRRRLGELVKRLQARGVRIAGAVIVDVPAERQHPYAGPTLSKTLREEWQRLSRLVRRSPTHA